MKRIILYILGGIIILLFITGILDPKLKKEMVQNIDLLDNKVSSTSQTPSTNEKTTPDASIQYYPISSVVDGDTVKINVNGTIKTYRLIGIDTPETVDPRKEVQCFGKEASNEAKELLSGKTVRIETDSSQGTYDKYNRLLVYIYLPDGLFYNKYMIEQGYAHEYTYDKPYKYQTVFKNAQKEAEINRVGLWSPSTCNGDTTSSSTTTTSTSTTQSNFKFYTSSYSTSKYYYPVSCNDWKSLNPNYLKGFNALNDLLKSYPSRTESPSC